MRMTLVNKEIVMFYRKRRAIAVTFVVILLLGLPSAWAHVDDQPSVYDAVAAVQARLIAGYPFERLNALTVEEVVAELAPEERRILGSAHIVFEVNVPVAVYVLHDAAFTETTPLEPFWLEERGFEQTSLEARRGSDRFIAFTKSFEAGRVGLGVNSFSGANQHYFIAVKPLEPGASLEISSLYPAYFSLTKLAVGAQPYPHPAWGPLTAVAPELEGLTMIQVDPELRRATRLTSVYSQTRYPSGPRADQVTLTWSDCPQTTQTIQWRTNMETERGAVAYLKKSAYNRFTPGKPQVVEATSLPLHTPRVTNDPYCRRHTVVLTDLEPDTAYLYAVGDGTEEGWGELAEFSTAPAEARPFSFIYMGDVQNGFERWRTLATRAYRDRPDAAFYLLAGDLVNRGNDRDDWDDFFFNARGVFDRRPVAPALGNHEYHSGQEPHLYHALFTLLENGPKTVPAERAYRFRYGNALFVVLDSNLDPEAQTEWLDESLADPDAVWKFVAFHHPIYSSSPRRDNPWLRDAWLPIFDKHHVDLVLQGHDHAYLRTYPMKENARVDGAAQGTIYLVSMAGTKMYEQDKRDYAEVGFVNTSTFQVLDIQLHGNRLVYHAYDIDGNRVDDFVIEK